MNPDRIHFPSYVSPTHGTVAACGRNGKGEQCDPDPFKVTCAQCLTTKVFKLAAAPAYLKAEREFRRSGR